MAPAIASLAPKKMSATRKIRSHLLLAVLCNYSCVFYKVFILIKKERAVIVKDSSDCGKIFEVERAFSERAKR